ncbi:dihydrofolate reductase family protein [Streptomyces sp. NPDC004658]|uniref:dihydrofolate reductase family protein n=1 Tax=Streptomyces sp. NPDC004658 TaxID=3154672 RepID=UPI00339E96AA
MALSLDGRYAGPHPQDMSWVMPYAVSDVARDHLTSLWQPATTALLGRVNAEGFRCLWLTVIGMQGADPQDERFAKWLVETDKVLLSFTLREAPRERTTISDKPTAQAVVDLRATEGGDILVLSSASVIQALLATDMVDRLALTVFPDVAAPLATASRGTVNPPYAEQGVHASRCRTGDVGFAQRLTAWSSSVSAASRLQALDTVQVAGKKAPVADGEVSVEQALPFAVVPAHDHGRTNSWRSAPCERRHPSPVRLPPA